MVGVDVCEAIKKNFTTGHLLKEWNHTNLVLIPKVQNPETLSQFRPISLCNFKLKIVSKIVANRLKLVLQTIISPQQSAFVPGRLIQDNIIVAHEVFHHLKLKKRSVMHEMAVKIDFNKAYDHVQWDFLRALLGKMGFPTVWIQWVMELVSTANRRDCQALKVILDVYNFASGQLINFEKSGIIFSANTPEGVKFEITALLGMSPSIRGTRYLGLLMFWGRSKSKAFGCLIEKAVTKIMEWKQNLLSQAGREVLIKSVIQAIPAYAMACFAFLKKFCKSLNSYINNFWWGSDPLDRGFH
ncbi:uncharacterized protein LOC114269058 [Camellia sinensis]|uniref:uncharacterized protein LOC114269058 n=1 Tax=Camellia sinensis TaxID=4442 RepID=UPI001035F3A3|nr:uncharacterized protein LOC114269058 [Camellia sinensis]